MVVARSTVLNCDVVWPVPLLFCGSLPMILLDGGRGDACAKHGVRVRTGVIDDRSLSSCEIQLRFNLFLWYRVDME